MGLFNVVLKVAARNITPFLMVFLTGISAAVLLFPIVLFKEKIIFSKYGLIGGLLWGLSVAGLNMALAKGEVSRVFPVFALNGVIAAVIGIFFLKEPVTTPKIIGIVLSAIAIILVSI
jgi:uncharacterized membrane protein